MAALRELVNPSHILFGSDFPFAPATAVTIECQTLDASPIFDDSVKYGICRGHALRLFPQYKGADEAVVPMPVFARQTFSERRKRFVSQTAGRLLERVRNR